MKAVRNLSFTAREQSQLPMEQRQRALMNEEQWASYMAHEIDQAWRRPAPVITKSIFSVPPALFEIRPRSYRPRIVTIGPLSRQLEPLPMDSCKALCMKEFMSRRGLRMQELLDHTIPDPENLRNIYFGLPEYNKETLKLLLTVDVVFIHEFLFYLSRDSKAEDELCGYLHPFLFTYMSFAQLCRDIFLVGNQVPMSFLKRLTELPNQDLTMEDFSLSIEYLVWTSNPFCTIRPDSTAYYAEFMNMLGGVSLLDCEHLLDCCYAACVKSANEVGTLDYFYRPKLRRLPSALDLSKVGVKFASAYGNVSIARYDKRSHTLILPKLQVHDDTEDIFRNLVAHELTSKGGSLLSGYTIIMDSLINTSEDLSILYKAGVLENRLGSDEKLLGMWREMCINIFDSSSEKWEAIVQDIMIDYMSPWRNMCTEFYLKFFSRPWLWISLVAATLLLGMSTIQTLYSVMGYYKG